MRVYMFGIGGVSMSALALMLKNEGVLVGGSDEMESQGTQILRQNGVDIDFDVNEQHISLADLIVASSAIKDDDARMVLAKNMGKKVISRGRLLGDIANAYEKVVAVAGSHGKTTTTAMLFEILNVAGCNPTLHLGGFRVVDGKNYHIGGKEWLVTEACEYHNNFLFLHPYLSVVTNIEKEHLDFFKTFENQKKSFEIFKKQSLYVVDGFEDLTAENVSHNCDGKLCFTLKQNGKDLFDVRLQLCEEVNTENCMHAYLAAKRLGIDDCFIKLGLERFKGVKCRFEKMKCSQFENCVCDYAHHPTEIARAIETAKKVFSNQKLVTIFQPHTYSRTKNLLNEFVDVFKDVEIPLFYKTYAAREQESDGVSSQELCKIVEKHNKNAKYFDDFVSLNCHLESFNGKNYALLFVGAGDLPSVIHKNHFVE